MPCFRPPTDEEVSASYAAYRAGDVGELMAVWARVASPTRATVPFPASLFYARMGWLPPRVNGVSFLLTVRAGLAAGVRFRDGLSAPVAHSIAHDFPWLEQRHQHVPDGYTAALDFPGVFAAFVDVPDLGDAQARWQLCAGVNEVQQAAYSRWAAQAWRLPDLARHAAREEALAHNYLGHWSPACTPELWRQTLWVLDALNAAIFDWVVNHATVSVMGRSVCGAFGDTWDRFVRGLDTPQVLVPVGDLPAWRTDLAG